MKKIVLYLFFTLSLIAGIWIYLQQGTAPTWIAENSLAIQCMLISSLGGALYCLRGVYLNKSVKNNWDKNWETWYYLRPPVSAITGLIAFIFMKAGLIVLEADSTQSASNFGYLAFAFIAGFNVDKFLAKLEDIAKSVFGIDKSRSANSTTNESTREKENK